MAALALRFLRRSREDRRLLVRALVLHAGIAVLLRVAPFGRLTLWTQGEGAGSQALDGSGVARIVTAVRQASRVLPWGRTCLTEAMTAATLLRRVGCEATVRYGVGPPDTGRLAAHAWLEHNGAVILGESVHPFMPLQRAGRRS
jgi:hypothetical protein